MRNCSRCGAEVSPGGRYCEGCGVLQSSASQMPTAFVEGEGEAPRAFGTGAGSRAHAPGSPSPSASPSLPIGRLHPSLSSATAPFVPGQIIAGRYRMIGLLGHGGMGEVYRVDDLKLGQPVSLKILPPSLAQDPTRLDRFLAEVRLARQVSHPNVCRVYDVGEVDGIHFLTMEYVDGEDLATLLRRIGRVPGAKAHEIARQLCAGLAAAHDKKVLHRDLKPSNLMIDGDGRARLTDFGLAIPTSEGAGGGFAGTPAYMAPEQFTGGAYTEKADLYSLGLVLYELYTGHRAFEGSSFADWKERHTRSMPTPPSGMERDIDEAAERVILRCLEKDPARRPASALQVAAALPGGDPLAAALAAGETPSPEMVAAAGGEGAISLPRALVLAAGILAAWTSIVLIAPYSTDLGLSRPIKGPEVLADRARQIAARFGYDARPLDSSSWFRRDYEPLLWLSKHAPSTEWRARMHDWPPPILFVHRQSPRWLLAPYADVNEEQPPHEVSGMTSVLLDGDGNLRALRGVPPQKVESAAPAQDLPDWKALFTEAGLSFERFTAVAPTWVPPSPFDAWMEWSGVLPYATDVPIRVSAASFRGRPVSFEVLGPWSTPQRMEEKPVLTSRWIAQASFGLMITVVVVFGLILVRRNLKRGRGDRRGALRLGLVVFASETLRTLAGAHHVLDVADEAGLVVEALARALVTGVILGFFYIAVEPYVRGRMPELLIGWARLLEGRFRDPRVGRDILAGTLVGGLAALSLHVTNALPTWIPIPGQTTIWANTNVLYGGRRLLADLVGLPTTGLIPAMTLLVLLLLFRIVLRRPALAMIAVMAVITLVNLGGENVFIETPGALVMGVLAGYAIARFGFLTAVTMFLIFFSLSTLPLPPASFYAIPTLIFLAVLVAVAAYAFRVSIGRRPLFGDMLES